MSLTFSKVLNILEKDEPSNVHKNPSDVCEVTDEDSGRKSEEQPQRLSGNQHLIAAEILSQRVADNSEPDSDGSPT